MYEKKLVFSIPPVVSYLHHSCSLSVLSCYEDTVPWFMSNYIQLKCQSNFREIGNDLYYDFVVGDVYGGVPWLNHHKFNSKNLFSSETSINKFIQSCIDSDYYIYFNLDEFFIPDRAAYEVNHYKHGNMIYGYDLNNKIYYIAGMNSTGHFKDAKISFSELTTCIIGIPQSNTLNEKIFLIKKKKSLHYEFNISNITEGLNDYLLSQNYYTKLEKYFDLKTRKFTELDIQTSARGGEVTGISTYECIVDFVNSSLKNGIEIDFRPLHCLWEHKKCMLLRLDYLDKNGYLENYKDIFEQYKVIEQSVLSSRNLIIKFKLNKNKKLVEKAINNISDIVIKERSAINQMLNSIKKRSVDE